jgi:hypothetical protein
MGRHRSLPIIAIRAITGDCPYINEELRADERKARRDKD